MSSNLNVDDLKHSKCNQALGGSQTHFSLHYSKFIKEQARHLIQTKPIRGDLELLAFGRRRLHCQPQDLLR